MSMDRNSLALSHIEWVRRSEDNETLGTIGFPGSGGPRADKSLVDHHRLGDREAGRLPT